MDQPQTFTGRHRRRKTRWTVRWADRVARATIAVGGIGTIAAVCLVCVFLVWVVMPLFKPARLGEASDVAAPTLGGAAVHFGVDDYRLLAWTLSPEGRVRVVRLDTGETVEDRPLAENFSPTAASVAIDGRSALFGFADGSVRTARLSLAPVNLPRDAVPAAARQLSLGESKVVDGALVTRTPQGQFRSQKLLAELSEPIAGANKSAIKLIDGSVRSTGFSAAALDAEGNLNLLSTKSRRNILSDETKTTVVRHSLPLAPREGHGQPSRVLLSGLADNAYLIWNDGYLGRYDTRDLTKPQLAEEVDLVPDSNVEVTAVEFLLGKTTLAVGDSSGRVRTWFRIKPADAGNVDGAVLAPAHTFAATGSPVTALASSARKRMLAAGYADGRTRLFYVTNERELVDAQAPGDQAIAALAIAPRDDGLAVLSGETLVAWPLDPGFPEVTLSSLFRPQWYEGYERPEHVWQSSGGTDDFEPKLGLAPLVFGTIKATFYSMLFAVPLALAAAVFSSEFLHPRTKQRFKPAIEMMASLPSVVLGFIAGVVVAPFVESTVPAVLAGIVVLPLTLLFGAYLWQLLPQRVNLLLAPRRLWFVAAMVPVGVLLSWLAGPLLERLLFSGDLRSWLAGQTGTGVGGWMLFVLPWCAIATAYGLSRTVNPWLRGISDDWSRARWAIVDLMKFAGAVVVAFAGAWFVAMLLDRLLFDPRGWFLGTYVQRNALVVGFVMGFAVIPLIYTIADDALSTVPGHLRSASLGAGATPWQTATRIIIPAAMSGLFSAVMIGLGRAVGETMIVLMAAGNTPIMDWNVFNGFQTLSANIATELPEAVQGSAHYRTLFVAALSLFAVTFVVNTVAEVVRQRFRRRAYEL